ncbi:lariat debranching enzyme [Boothiomyces sp. JEL0866]|nr:lariat debranching enzyme [Boothiomyces sp. JEL0866]
MSRSLRVAIEGCCHGELDKIYEAIQEKERQCKYQVDLLLICGDFQSIRNYTDLNSMAVPEKYKKIGNFYQYYIGEKIAPIPTVFIGGNHEASNYLHELFHGGYVCPNIYYLGSAGVINFGGLRIAGLSGIYKGHDYRKGFFERQPLNQNDQRSIYHLRKFNVMRMYLINSPIDVFLSHDWPQGIAKHGNLQELLKWKSFLKKEIDNNTLGSPPLLELLKKLRPKYWFSAHLHVKYAATFVHEQETENNPDELDLDVSDEEEEIGAPKLPKSTKFLSLDKCLPNRGYLEIVEIPVDSLAEKKITFDREWLAIVKTMNQCMSVSEYPKFPTKESLYPLLKENLAWIDKKEDSFFDVHQFVQTAKPFDPQRKNDKTLDLVYSNPQTAEFCSKLEIDNLINPDGVSGEQVSEAYLLEQAKKRCLSLLDD